VLLFQAVFVHSAEPTLLEGSVFGNFNSGEYLVSGICVVPPAKELFFGKGAQVYFLPRSGILVKGSLSCKGTTDEPVVLTSVCKKQNKKSLSDSKCKWKGIKQKTDSAVIAMSFTHFSDADTAIILSFVGKNVSITNCVFHDDSRTHLVIGNAPVQIVDKRNFTLDTRKSGVFETVKPNLEISKSDTVIKKRFIAFRIASATIAVGGLITGLALHGAAKDKQEQYESTDDKAVANTLRDERDGRIAGRNIGFGIAATGALFFGLSFAF